MSSKYRLVMRAYPADYRARHGAEIVDTACQLAEGSWSPRQALSLLWGGLGARGQEACENGGVALVAAGARIGLLLALAQSVASVIVFKLGVTGDITELSGTGSVWAMALAVVAMVFTTRWPTATLVTAAWVWVVISSWSDQQGGFAAVTVSVAVVFAAMAWWLALASDGRRAANPRALALGLVAAVGISVVVDSPVVLALYALTLGGLFLVGLMIVAVDPRLLIAASTMWLLYAVSATALAASFQNGALWIAASVPAGVTVVSLTASVLSARRLTAASAGAT